ncbi:unnamed protein product [Rangifer tarandus platyrhynchus]|uniref:V-type proton ATPase subunit G n=1 Tax=Rangifer tarandus platyrhynchus TaxID=3082113 RepID=A0ABN8ZL91_RANTA|nr:unnamed protein product [Rangifer tarandus platyrhynchus]
MASQSQGIQQLLQAEKRAAEKVSDGRKRKSRRLKQAKEEAQAESEQYRLQREKEFKNRDEVLDNLLAFVCDIRPEIHENYRING